MDVSGMTLEGFFLADYERMRKLDNAGWTKIEQMYDDAASAAEHS